METVGARLGRSSTRYGPATVFTGPVRRWKKKWVHVASSSSSSSASASNGHANHTSLQNGSAVNGANGSRLLLYKWTPLTQSPNSAVGNGNGNGDGKVATSSKDDSASEEPPRRKFKYVPVAVLEEQKYDAAEDEATEKECADVDASTKDEKPDINDVPMDDNEETSKVVCQDLNESTLDLSLGLNGHDGDDEPDSKDTDCRDS